MSSHEQNVRATPERISELALQLQVRIRSAVEKIERVNLQTRVDDRPALVAHACSPGYETYRTGWHSLIVEFSS